MSDLFQDGNQASGSTFMAALEDLRTQGQAVLDSLSQDSLSTLIRFQQDLSALNGRRQRAFRVPDPDTAGAFLVSDFLEIDQADTNATVRADSASVTLRERNRPAEATVQSTVFSASAGSIEQFSGMYRVSTWDGSAPVGTFEIQFFSALNFTLLLFDIVMSPAHPEIKVQVSADGISYVDAEQVSMAGYHITAYIPAGTWRFARISVTPSHPDTLGGNAYTFGITSFAASLVEFQLQSQVAMRRIGVKPATSKLQFVADEGSGLVYFLAVGEGVPFIGVVPGDVIPVPGAVNVDSGLTAFLDPTTGKLSWRNETNTFTVTLPANLYPSSLSITDANGNAMRVLPGLNPAFAQHLKVPSFALFNGELFYTAQGGDLVTPRFRVAYTAGPQVIPAALQVQLITRDRASTPMFTGAYLKNYWATS